MKNKRLILILVLIIIVILGSVVVITNISNNKKQEKTVEESMFSINNAEQINDVCKDFDLKYEINSDLNYVYDVPCFNERAQFCYSMEENQVLSINCALMLFGYEKDDPDTPVKYTNAELKKSINSVLDKFCEMHGVSLDDRFFIFEETKLLDNKSDDSYKKIMNGTAHIEFGLRDANDYYWTIKSEKMDDGVIFLMINKYYDKEAYSENVPNIYVEE